MWEGEMREFEFCEGSEEAKEYVEGEKQ